MGLPSDVLAAKLQAGQAARIVIIGDSTAAGVGDVTFAGGWPPRFAQLVGAHFGCSSVRHNGSGPWSYPPATAGALSVSTLGLPGNSLPHYYNGSNGTNGINGQLLIPPPDMVIIYDGFNYGLYAGGVPFLTAMLNFCAAVREKAPNAAIVITDQNRYGSGNYINAHQTVAQGVVGASLPLTPPLYESSIYENYWYLDTMQAWGASEPGMMYDGLHPNVAGYTRMAQFVLDVAIKGELGGGTGGGTVPAITTVALSSIYRNVSFSQNLSATGTTPITYTLQAGSLPPGMSLTTAGRISGTAGNVGPYDFTVRATNEHGYDDQRFTGSVISNSVLFNFSEPARVMTKRPNGLYYPAVPHMKVGGEFLRGVVHR